LSSAHVAYHVPLPSLSVFHPVKVYPVNVKLLSGAISPLSYFALIVAGAVHVASAAFQLNEIVYVIGVH
jgi:hypothetical protein